MSCVVLAGPRRNGVNTCRSTAGSRPASAGSAPPKRSDSSALSYPAGESSGSVTRTQSASDQPFFVVLEDDDANDVPDAEDDANVPDAEDGSSPLRFAIAASSRSRCVLGSHALTGTSGTRPALMACAALTMPLCSACLKTSLSCTAGTAPELSRSRRTLPGPTLGSWSASPTNTSCASGLTASSSAAHSGRSSMLLSSTTTTSASSGELASRAKRPSYVRRPPSAAPSGSSPSGSPSAAPAPRRVSSRRWIVLDWTGCDIRRPAVAISASLCAARPVGAHISTLRPIARHRRTAMCVAKVFPVPGPPVRTLMGSRSARSRNASCAGERRRHPSFCAAAWSQRRTRGTSGSRFARARRFATSAATNASAS